MNPGSSTLSLVHTLPRFQNASFSLSALIPFLVPLVLVGSQGTPFGSFRVISVGLWDGAETNRCLICGFVISPAFFPCAQNFPLLPTGSSALGVLPAGWEVWGRCLPHCPCFLRSTPFICSSPSPLLILETSAPRPPWNFLSLWPPCGMQSTLLQPPPHRTKLRLGCILSHPIAEVTSLALACWSRWPGSLSLEPKEIPPHPHL